MTPRWGEYDLLLFFLSDSSFQSRTHEGLFELTRRLSRTLCNVLGAEVPGHRKQQWTQTVNVRLLKTHFFTMILDCEKSTE